MLHCHAHQTVTTSNTRHQIPSKSSMRLSIDMLDVAAEPGHGTGTRGTRMTETPERSAENHRPRAVPSPNLPLNSAGQRWIKAWLV